MKNSICYDSPSVGGSSHWHRPYGVPHYVDVGPDFSTSSAMWSLDTVLRIMLEPAGFFRDRRQDCAFSTVAAFGMIHAVVLTVVGFVAGLIGVAASGDVPSTAAETVRMLAALGVYASVAAVVTFVVSAIIAMALHLVALIVRGRGGFEATYAAVVYAAAPAGLTFVLGLYITELVPDTSGGSALATWLNVGGVLWSLALFGIGMSELHGLNALEGTAVTTVPLAAAALLAIWVANPSLAPWHGLIESHPEARRHLIPGLPLPNPLHGVLPGYQTKAVKSPPMASAEKHAPSKPKASRRPSTRHRVGR
jgi:hypothetical protein